MSRISPSERPAMLNVQSLISEAVEKFGVGTVASTLGVEQRTVRRWIVGESSPPPYLGDALRQRLLPLPLQAPKVAGDFTFIDLFAGIGGMRTAFEASGGRCVFTSEWDDYAVKTYVANFPPTAGHSFAGDITAVDEADVPDHDVLVGGFPCQPFSIAGVSKKNALGRPHGFGDKTQGTLFFDVARIIDKKRPKAFLLENVKNLVSHDKGRTFATIVDVLRNELGYNVWHRVINGKHFVPQNRERIIIVGFRDTDSFTWDDLQLPAIENGPKLGSILHPQDGSEAVTERFIEGTKGKIAARYTLTDNLWTYLQGYARKHQEKGNGFGFGLVTGKDTTRTLSARYYKDGSEILVSQGKGKNPRRLTPRECARLMGFQDDFVIPVSDTRAYKQFGNSVVVPVIAEVARIMRPHLLSAPAVAAAKRKRAA